MDGLYTLIEITKKHFYNLKILPIQKKNLTSINFNLDLFLFPYVNKTTWKMSSVHKYTCALGIFLKNHKNMVRLYMSLCQITGSCGPYRCNARAEDKFQKVCSLTNPPPPPPPEKKTFMYQRLLVHFRLWADLRFPSLIMTLYVYAQPCILVSFSYLLFGYGD